MTNSIDKQMFLRLAVQKDEAEVQGLYKIAKALEEQLESHPIRSAGEIYQYAAEELQADMEAGLWRLAMRTADYYGTTPDAREVQILVEKVANEFVEELRQKMGAEYGAHEKSLPGEMEVMIEVNLE